MFADALRAEVNDCRTHVGELKESMGDLVEMIEAHTIEAHALRAEVNDGRTEVGDLRRTMGDLVELVEAHSTEARRTRMLIEAMKDTMDGMRTKLMEIEHFITFQQWRSSQ
jgi:HAMP domain-containing protein